MFIPTETQLAVATTSGGHAGALFMSHTELTYTYFFGVRNGLGECVCWVLPRCCGIVAFLVLLLLLPAKWCALYGILRIYTNTHTQKHILLASLDYDRRRMCVYNTDAQRVESYYPHIARTVEYSGHISSTICCCFNNFTRSQRGIWHAIRGRRGWWWFCRLCVYLCWGCERIWSIGSSSTVAAAECLC